MKYLLSLFLLLFLYAKPAFGQSTKKLYAIVELDGKYGLISNPDSVIIPFKFHTIDRLPSGYLIAAVNGKWGVINPHGKILTEFKYEYIRELASGYFIAVLNKKAGIINPQGKILTKFKYDFIRDFKGVLHTKLFEVGNSKQNNKDLIGLIDTLGKIVVPIKFESISTTNFKNVLKLKKNKSSIQYYESHSGKLLSDNYEYDLNQSKNFIFYSKKGKQGILKYGIKDSLFNTILPVKYYHIEIYNSEKKMFIVQTKTKKYILKNNKKLFDVSNCYYIKNLNDSTFSAKKENLKRTIYNCKNLSFYSRNNFFQCKKNRERYYLIVENDSANNLNSDVNSDVNPNKYSIKKHKPIIRTDEERHFDTCIYNLEKKYGRTLNRISRDRFTVHYYSGKYMLIDLTGKIILPLKYDQITPLKYEQFRVKLNNKYGIINKNGQEITPICYLEIEDSYYGKNYIVDKDGRADIVDSTGKELILNPQIIEINDYRFHSNYLLTSKDNNIYKHGVANSDGKIIIPIQYDYIHFLNNDNGNYYTVKKNDKSGIIDSTGKIIIPLIYDGINYLQKRIYKIIKNNYIDSTNEHNWINDRKIGIIDSTGKEVLECK